MRLKANLDIRKKAKDNGVAFWEIGKVLGVSEFTIIRRLREELPEQKKQEMLKAIDMAAEKNAAEASAV